MLAMCALLCFYLFTVWSCVSEALMLDLHNLSCSCLFTVCSGVSEALILALCNLSTLLCFIARNILSDCAFRLDGKA